MDKTVLGRTGLSVSVMGMGCGGPSSLGTALGHAPEDSAAIVRRALELGVNFIDTAEAYGTEEIVGQAIAGVPRDQVVLATKKTTWYDPARRVTACDLEASLETSLRRLGTDYIDIYQLHCVTAENYRELSQELVPAMRKQQQKGKIRFLGLTEYFERDPSHRMLEQALADDVWDVVMVGFNMLNPSARTTIFPRTRARKVGTLVMFAVRKALSRPERLEKVVTMLVEKGQLDGSAINWEDPLGFLVDQGGAASIEDAAYRFCRHEPGVDVVLSGTSSIEHLEANAGSCNGGPLPKRDRARLVELFGKVDSVTGG